MPRGKTTKARKQFVPLTLRLAPDLHAQIVAEAASKSISLNEYISIVLGWHLAGHETTVEQRVAELERKYAEWERKSYGTVAWATDGCLYVRSIGEIR